MTKKGWREGDRVLAPWEPEWLYPGLVRCIDGEVAFIRFDDGDYAIVPLIELRALSIVTGDCVHARRERFKKEYEPALVVEINGEDLQVQYEDGQTDGLAVGYVRVQARRVLEQYTDDEP